MQVAGWILVGIGCICGILGGLFWGIGKGSGKKKAVTDGRIVDLCFDHVNYNMGGSGRVKAGIKGAGTMRTAYPVFSYTVNGVEYRKAGTVAYNRGTVKKKIGKDCKVYYDPQNPNKASLGKNSVWAVLGKVFLPVGLGLLLLGLLFLMLLGNAASQGNEGDGFSGQEGGKNGETETVDLREVSFHGMKIGDRASKKMKDGELMDSYWRYEDDAYVKFNVDGQDRIEALGFHTVSAAGGEVIAGIEDAKIEYRGKSLVTVEDFAACFGEGETFAHEEDPDFTYIRYESNGLELTLELYQGEFINLTLE